MNWRVDVRLPDGSVTLCDGPEEERARIIFRAMEGIFRDAHIVGEIDLTCDGELIEGIFGVTE